MNHFMRRLLVSVLVSVSTMCSLVRGDDKVVVYQANSPVSSLAKVFSDVSDSVSFRAVLESNTLIISADEGSIAKIMEVLQQIDPRPQSIRIHSYVLGLAEGEEVEELTGSIDAVAKKIETLAKSKRVVSVAKVQMTTLNQQTAFVHIGEQKGVETASMSRGGRDVKQYKTIQVGSVVGITPRVGNDATCQLEIDVERSSLRPSADDSPSGTVEMKVNTTVSVPLGTLVEVQRTRDALYDAHQVLLVGVEIIGAVGNAVE